MVLQSQTVEAGKRPAYGDQVSVFPVHLGDGSEIWMRARDDMPWDTSHIVWCDAARLSGVWRTAGADRPRIGVSHNKEQWPTVERAFANSRAWPVPVAYAHVNYHRRAWPWGDLAEATGLYGLSTRPVLGFMDGRHRTAWLLERGAPVIPIMTDTWWNLSNFAGTRIVTVDLSKLVRPQPGISEVRLDGG